MRALCNNGGHPRFSEGRNGISCDRKTIPGDIAKLCDIGIDIEEERSRENRYSLSSHLFTLPELKLLIDAVESSKFITVKKSAELIEKLSQMTSIHRGGGAEETSVCFERSKTAERADLLFGR